MIKACKRNNLNYKYILADSWFSSRDNMNCIKHDIKKDFIMALKTNRLAALSLEDKIKGRFVRIDSLEKKSNTVKQVYLKGIAFPLTLTKQVFTNNDGSIGVLYLISNDINLTYDQITTIYQKSKIF
jgi:hypothetical protein